MARVRGTEYGTSKEILKNLDPFTANPVMVSDEDVTANAEGKKIVKAGSFLDVDGKVVVVGTNSADVVGVLLRDTDVTYGPREGANVYHGTVDLDKIPVQPDADIIAALPRVSFRDDSYSNGL